MDAGFGMSSVNEAIIYRESRRCEEGREWDVRVISVGPSDERHLLLERTRSIYSRLHEV